MPACKSDEDAADQGGADGEVESALPGGTEDETGEIDPADQPEEPEEETPDAPEGEAPEQESVTVTLYTGNENADGLDETQTELAELSPDELIAALVEAEAIPEQTKCLSFEQSEDGKRICPSHSPGRAERWHGGRAYDPLQPGEYVPGCIRHRRADPDR